MASVSGLSFVVRRNSNQEQQQPIETWFSMNKIFPDLVCAVRLEPSSLFVALVFGIQVNVYPNDSHIRPYHLATLKCSHA